MSEGNAQEPRAPTASPEDERALPPPAERMSSEVRPQPDSPARRRDKLLGTIIVVVAFVLSLAISLWAKHASRPEVSEPPRPPTTEGVVGFPAKVDWVATLPAARALTRRTMLRGIVAEGVKSDGTVDLGEGPARVRYTFQSPAGHGPQPPREPGTLPRQLYCGKQTVQLRKEGLVADPDRAEAGCPTTQQEPLPDPQCPVTELWRKAIERGVPADRLARLEYYRSKAGPAWRFELPGSKHRFVVLGDCQRELSGGEAHAVQN